MIQATVRRLHPRDRPLEFGVLALILLGLPVRLPAQDWLRHATGLGAGKPRVAVAEFVPRDGTSEPWAADFSRVLRSDLDYSGILELLGRTSHPPDIPALPRQLNYAEWTAPALAAQFLAFGNVTVGQRNFSIEAWFYDLQNRTAAPLVTRVFAAELSDAQLRKFAHEFADEIVAKLSGGMPGIASTEITFISARGGNKEIWLMDYDGADQRQLTFLRSTALTPRWSPDSSRIAFTCYPASDPASAAVAMSQICLVPPAADGVADAGARVTSWPPLIGTNTAPAWAPDGRRIVFTSSSSGNPELFVADAAGHQPRQITHSTGASTSAAFDPSTGGRIAFVSDRDGFPQLYIMSAGGDGEDTRKLPLPGMDYVADPAWSHNGQLLAFSRRLPNGDFDIYVMDVVSRQFVDLTPNARRNQRPSWAPDGRHIVFDSTRTGSRQIWSMLADGTRARQLTTAGENESPDWSPTAVH